MKTMYPFLVVLIVLLFTQTTYTQSASCEEMLRGAIGIRTEKPDSALAILDEIIDQCSTLGDGFIGKIYNVIGTIKRDQGKYLQSKDAYEAALSYYERINDTLGLAKVSNNYSQLEMKQENYQEALNYTNNAIMLFESLDEKISLGRALINKGNIYIEKSDFKNARIFIVQGDSIANLIQDDYAIKLAEENLITIDLFEGKSSEALISRLKILYNEYKENGELVYAAETTNKVGLAYSLLGDDKSAIPWFQEAIQWASNNESFRLAHEAGSNLNLAQSNETRKQKIFLLSGLIGAVALIFFLMLYIRKEYQLNKREKRISKLTNLLSSTQPILDELAQYIHNKYSRDANEIKDMISQVKVAVEHISPDLSLKLAEACLIADRAYDYSRTTGYVVRPTKVKWQNWVNANVIAFILDKGVDLKYDIWGVNEASYDREESGRIFDIIYNLINNIKKHAKAKKVRINIKEMLTKLIIDIEDDGIGFDWPRVKGVGLKSVMADVDALKGSLEIASMQEGIKGTHIKVSIPLKKKKNGKLN